MSCYVNKSVSPRTSDCTLYRRSRHSDEDGRRHRDDDDDDDYDRYVDNMAGAVYN